MERFEYFKYLGYDMRESGRMTEDIGHSVI